MKNLLLVLLFLSCSIYPQTNLMREILSNGKEIVQDVISQHEKYKIQIIYTQVDRDENNKPNLTTYSLYANNNDYFYPASSVKFPAALLALEKLNGLKIDGLTKYSPLTIDSVYSGQSFVKYDSSSENNFASIAHYIKKILLASDNDAYNRIYEFVGHKSLNESLWKKGYTDVRLNHRLSIFLSDDENRHTNPFNFYNNNEILYTQPEAVSDMEFTKTYNNEQMGTGFYRSGELINEPMDFSAKNYFSLVDIHEILKAVIFPEEVPQEKRFNLTDDDYNFIYKYMMLFPRESDYPGYDPAVYFDSFVKFFMFDKKNTNIRELNKVGLAYGFLIDNAYIIDLENNIEFLLSATIYVNDDGIFNDDKYEYDEIGFPFMEELGRIFYNYEITRDKKNSPDLEKFRKLLE